MAQNYKTGLIITGDASGGIRAIKATDNELGKLNQGFDRGGRRSKQFTQNINGTSRELQVLRRAAAPIAGIIAGMFAANSLQNQINWADQLQKTNLRIGASTEALSQYNYVAKLSGVEFGQLTTAWQRQTRRIAEAADGTGVAVAALDRLNLSAKELNQLAPEDQFERIAEAMQGVESSSDRVRLAQQLWDSEGVKLVQIVNQGTDAMAAMRAEADALGLTISQDTANAMATYNDEVDKLKFAAQGVSQTLLSELVPAMTSGLQSVNAFIQEVGGAEVVVGHLTDGAQVLAALLAGRYAGAFATATAAKLAATQQSIAYQMALARMAGVSATAAGAQASLAAATRGAGAAMALVGGPLGAAMIAGGAIYYFREELGLTIPALDANSTAVNQLTGNLNDLSRAEAQLTLTRLVGQLAEAKALAEDASQAIIEVGRPETPSGGGGGILGVSGSEITRQVTAIKETGEAAKGASQDVVNLEAAIDVVTGRLQELGNQGERTTVVTTELGDATETAAAQSQAHAEAADAQAKALENLRNRLIPGRRETVQLAKETNTLALAMAMGKGNTAQLAQMMGLLQKEYIEGQRETENLAESTVQAAFTMEGAWDEVRLNGLRRLDDGIANMWQNAIDGSLDAGEAMKRILNQTLAEMAHMAITRPIMVQIAGSVGMSGGGSGTGSTGAGGFDLSPGGISNAWNMVQNGFGGNSIGQGISSAATSAYGSLTGNAVSYGGSGWASSATAGNASWLNNPSQVSNISMGLQSLGGSYAGTELGSSVFGKEANSNYGAMAGSIAGSFLPIPGGTFIGATLGGMIDSLLGSSKKTFDFDFLQGQHSYVFGDRTSAFGDSGLTALSDYKLGEQQDQLNDMLTAMAEFDNRIAATAIPERFDAMKDAIDGFTHSGAEDLFETRLREMITGGEVWAAEAVASIVDSEKLAQGMLGALQLEQIGGRLGSELSAEIQAAIGDARGDQAAGVLQSTLADAQAAEFLHNSLERLNLQFDVTAQGALAAAGELSDYAGGVENLAALQSSYYDAFFTEQEKLDHLTQDLTQTFSALGMELPDSREGVRELVSGLELMEDAGQAQLATIYQTVPALRQYIDAMEQQGNALASSSLGYDGIANVDGAITDYNTAVDLANRVAEQRKQQLRDEQRAVEQLGTLINSLMLSNQSILDPAERLAEAQRQFADLQARAEMGDTEAAGQLRGASTSYLDAAAAYYGQSSDQYARIFGDVNNGITDLEHQFGQSVSALGSIESIEQRALREQQSAHNTMMRALSEQINANEALGTIGDLLASLPSDLSQALAAIIPGPSSGGSSGVGGGSASSTINRIYNDVLGRDADNEGAAYWASTGLTGQALRDAIAHSAWVDGSHATGLWSVPFDGYLAELHRNETVLPADEADAYRKMATLPMPQMPPMPLAMNTGPVANPPAANLEPLTRELNALRQEVAQLRDERRRDAEQAAGQRSEQSRELRKGNKNSKQKHRVPTV